MSNISESTPWILDLLRDLPPAVTPGSAERVLGITRPTLRNLIVTGELVAFRTGPRKGHYRICVSSIADFLARHAVQAGGR